MNLQKKSIRLNLLVLIKDITNKVHNKNKKIDRGSTLYSRRSNLDKKEKDKSKDNSRDNRDKDSKKDKLYKNYKNLNIYYKPNNYFITNKKLYYE